MSGRMLTRTRPRPVNTPSISELSDHGAESVIHTVPLLDQSSSPHLRLDDSIKPSNATLYDLISQRIQADNAKGTPEVRVAQTFRSVPAVSPIAAKQPQQHSLTAPSATSEPEVDMSVARAAGNLPLWHQHYKAAPMQLIAVPHDTLKRGQESVPEHIVPPNQSQSFASATLDSQRPRTAQYLPGAAANNKPTAGTISAQSNNFPLSYVEDVRQFYSPYSIAGHIAPGVLATGPPSNDVSIHNTVTHLNKETHVIANPSSDPLSMHIVRTTLANRVPAPAVMNPALFDIVRDGNAARDTAGGDAHGVTMLESKPEPRPTQSTAPAVDPQPLPAFSPISPEAIQEIVSIRASTRDCAGSEAGCKPKSEPEPLSVLIQKAILRQHQGQPAPDSDKMADIAARAQLMKGVYDITSRMALPSSMVEHLPHTAEKQSPPLSAPLPIHVDSVTISDSSHTNTESARVIEESRFGKEKSSKRSHKQKDRPAKTEKSITTSVRSDSDSDSYYYSYSYSSYSEDSEEKLKWISLGKDLSNYPLYLTKYAHCGKCQHSQEPKAVTEPSKSQPTRQNESMACQTSFETPATNFTPLGSANYTHKNPLLRMSPRSAQGVNPSPTAESPPRDEPAHAKEDDCVQNITRVTVLPSKKETKKDSSLPTKELVVTATRRSTSTRTGTPATSSVDDFSRLPGQGSPSVDINYNLNGFTRHEAEDVDYNTVLFVISKEKGDIGPPSVQANPAPIFTQRKLPPVPRPFKEAPVSPPMQEPLLSQQNYQPTTYTKPTTPLGAARYDYVVPQKEQPRPQLLSPSSSSAPAAQDDHDEVQAILAHPFRPSGAPLHRPTMPKTPSDLSYLTSLGNVLQVHSVSALSDTPERFQHYSYDSSMATPLSTDRSSHISHGGRSSQQVQQLPMLPHSTHLSHPSNTYTNPSTFTPNLNDETLSDIEEGEIVTDVKFNYPVLRLPHEQPTVVERFPSYNYKSPNDTGSEEVPSLIELANCSLTPEEDIALTKALEALSI